MITLSLDINSVKIRVSTIEKKIEIVNEAEPSPKTTIDNSDLIAKLMDKRNNIILHNLYESNKDSINDTSTLKEI